MYNVFVVFIINQLIEIKYLNALLIDLPNLHY